MSSQLPLLELYEEAFLLLPVPVLLVTAEGEFINVTYSFLEVAQTTTAQLKSTSIFNQWSAIEKKSSQPKLRDGWSGEVRWQGESPQSSILRIVIRSLGSGEPSAFLLFADATTTFHAAVGTGHNSRQHRLEALGLYTSSIAHDLSNVLTGVLGHVSYLRLTLPKNTDHQESIFAIEEGAKRAATMTQHILEYSRGEQSEYRQLQIADLVRSGVSLLREALPATVVLQVEGLDESVCALGDESQIKRCFINLIVNARDAVGEAGTISVHLDCVQLNELDARAVGLEQGNYSSLRVKDTGGGIPAQVQEHMFEPFFTTKSSGGTGLGLANVHSIVTAHGGAVRYWTEDGVGTEFEILLPLVTAINEVQAGVAERNMRGAERILVIDDEDSVRLIMQKSLEHLGYSVDVAANGEEALMLYRQNGREYGLVIMDMIMPGMPGDELFFELKRVDPEVTVLIASGYASDRRTRAVLDGGGVGMLRKPFAVEDLGEAVRNSLDKKSAK